MHSKDKFDGISEGEDHTFEPKCITHVLDGVERVLGKNSRTACLGDDAVFGFALGFRADKAIADNLR